MAKYRKIPVEIEAVKWNGNNAEEIREFTEGDSYIFNNCLFIRTLTGTVNANQGEYIIKTGAGNYQCCASDKFLKTYEEVK